MAFEGCGACCDVAVTGTMKSMLSNVKFIRPLPGNPVFAAGRWNGAVKVSFKSSHQWQFRKTFPQSLHGSDVRWIVRWRCSVHLTHCIKKIIIDSEYT